MVPGYAIREELSCPFGSDEVISGVLRSWSRMVHADISAPDTPLEGIGCFAVVVQQPTCQPPFYGSKGGSELPGELGCIPQVLAQRLFSAIVGPVRDDRIV